MKHIETEYEKQARELLEKFGVEFSAVLIGSDCPAFCDDALAGRDMDKVNVYPRKTHIHGKHYRCTFKRKDKAMSIDFWNSYSDAEETAYNFGIERTSCGHGPDCLCETRASEDGILIEFRGNVYWDRYRGNKPASYSVIRPMRVRKTPSAYDVLSCLTKNEPGTFEDFCSDYGYDTDSIRTHGVYDAVCVEYRKVTGFFSPEEIEALQEIQ